MRFRHANKLLYSILLILSLTHAYVPASSPVTGKMKDDGSASPTATTPSLRFSTYLPHGEQSNFGAINAVATDAAGYIYIAGAANDKLPLRNHFSTAQPAPDSPASSQKGFVAKLTPAGDAFVYSTFLGNGVTDVRDMAVDAAGNLYLTGTSGSHLFPATANSYSRTRAPNDPNLTAISPFVIRLDSEGNVTHATKVGVNTETPKAIVIDLDGGVIIGGVRATSNRTEHQRNFIHKIDSTFAALVYTKTILPNVPAIINDLALAPDGSLCFVGNATTSAANFTGVAPLQAVPAPIFSSDVNRFSFAMIGKFAPNGGTLTFLSPLGERQRGSGTGNAVETDAAGNMYVGGVHLPLVGSLNPPARDGIAGHLAKINPDHTAILYSIAIGTTSPGTLNGTIVNDIAVDSTGEVYATGEAYLSQTANPFPVVNGLQPQHAGETDAFITKIAANGNEFSYSSQLGGSGQDRGIAVALDARDYAVVVGASRSDNFPTAVPLYPTRAAQEDGFILKIADETSAAQPATPAPGIIHRTPSAGVRLTNPIAGVYAAPINFALNADASPSKFQIIAVEFYQNDGLFPLSTDTTAPYEFAYNDVRHNDRRAGGYKFYAVAYTTLGERIESLPVFLDITEDPPPVLKLTGVTNGQYITANTAVPLGFSTTDGSTFSLTTYHANTSNYLGFAFGTRPYIWRPLAGNYTLHVVGNRDNIDFVSPVINVLVRDAGATQFTPLLPQTRNERGTFFFTNAPTGLWFDPPMAESFIYTMTSDSLFTEVMDFPVGIDSDNRFTVSVGDITLGEFAPGELVKFSDFAARLGDLLRTGANDRRGVRAFKVSGITPAVDAGRDDAFPLRIAFDTPTASFTQDAGTLPTTETFAIAGTVRDAHGRGAANVRIDLEGSTPMTTMTDAQGRYDFAGVPAGAAYTVTARRTGAGFAPASHNFGTLTANATADFILTVKRRFNLRGR